MYGHADRIAGQDKGSGKLPALLDYFLMGAYNWEMTTSRNTQRDELLDDILASALANLTDYTDAPREIADTILAAGYRKPRTITTVEELDALPNEAVIRGRGSVYEHDRGYFHCTDGGTVDASLVSLPVTVLHEPEAEVGPMSRLAEIKAQLEAAYPHEITPASGLELVDALEAVEKRLSAWDQQAVGTSAEDSTTRALVFLLRNTITEALR